MVQHVSDARSNPNEQIEHAVRVIGRSKIRLAVFRAVYRGKKKRKTVPEIAKSENMPSKSVLDGGKRLADNGIVKQVKNGAVTCYEKDPFYTANKAKILSIVASPSKLAVLPTKSRPQINLELVKLSVPKRAVKTKQITIDDIDSFSAVRRVKTDPDEPYTRMLEAEFKRGIKRILKEKSSFKDWGGETNDLLTTNVRYKGKRISTAFAFKGRGKTGILTPAKMGKNGDQIQRLFQSPAELFVVQCWGQIAQSVVEQVQAFATVASLHLNETIFYCIISGSDSNRILAAYPNSFRLN